MPNLGQKLHYQIIFKFFTSVSQSQKQYASLSNQLKINFVSKIPYLDLLGPKCESTLGQKYFKKDYSYQLPQSNLVFPKKQSS